MLRVLRIPGTTIAAWMLAAAALAPGSVRAQSDAKSQAQPTAAQKYYISGTELMTGVRYLDAAEQFRLAIDEDPDYIDAYRSLAFVFTKMAESENEYYEDALEIYEQLEDKLPDDVEVRQNKAFVLTQLGELQAAVDTYHDILGIKPDDCTTYARIAGLEKQMGEKAGKGTDGYKKAMQSAIDNYTKIIDLCPDETYAYNELGELHFGMGNIEAATSVYDKLLAREPVNVDVNGRVGFLWYNAGKDADKVKKDSGAEMYKKSVKYFEKVMELDPTRVQYQGLLADAYKRSGQPEKSAKEYLKIIQADPTKADLYCNVGFSLLDADQSEGAIEMAMKAIADNAPAQGCLYSIWGKGLEVRANKLVEGYEFDRAIAIYTDAKAKFTLALGDKDFGDYATKQISRQDQLIERAKTMKLKYSQEAGGSK